MNTREERIAPHDKHRYFQQSKAIQIKTHYLEHMELAAFKKGLIGKTLTKSLAAFRKYPSIVIPFLIFTLIELIALISLYNIPRQPLVGIFGPPVRTFWGEKFLHYPYNFLILPKISYYSRIFLSVFLGSFLMGTAIVLIEALHYKKTVRIGKAFKAAFRKYILLLAVILFLTALYYFLEKFLTLGMVKYFLAGHKKLLFLRAKLWIGPILTILTFLLAVLLQSLFAYALPAIVIGNEKLLKALWKSLVLCKRLFITTIIIVTVTLLMFVPVLTLIYNSAFLINKLFPEFILYVLIAGVIVNSLIIDLCLTLFTTNIYLLYSDARADKPAQIAGETSQLKE